MNDDRVDTPGVDAPLEVDALIDGILSELHDSIQFYDKRGALANCYVIGEIEAVLRRVLSRQALRGGKEG